MPHKEEFLKKPKELRDFQAAWENDLGPKEVKAAKNEEAKKNPSKKIRLKMASRFNTPRFQGNEKGRRSRRPVFV